MAFSPHRRITPSRALSKPQLLFGLDHTVVQEGIGAEKFQKSTCNPMEAGRYWFHPTRLETRTKESDKYASFRV